MDDVVPAGQKLGFMPSEELDYCNLLNKTLPGDIRAIGASYVSPEFSARFAI